MNQDYYGRECFGVESLAKFGGSYQPEDDPSHGESSDIHLDNGCNQVD